MHILTTTYSNCIGFLLVSVEGFSEDEAAQILRIDVVTLRRLVEHAGREIATEIATNVLIIEDETKH
jgi:DNA-directed RNA polymerase specialized sigma24 family protein